MRALVAGGGCWAGRLRQVGFERVRDCCGPLLRGGRGAPGPRLRGLPPGLRCELKLRHRLAVGKLVSQRRERHV
jgi:hypothetical protein